MKGIIIQMLLFAICSLFFQFYRIFFPFSRQFYSYDLIWHCSQAVDWTKVLLICSRFSLCFNSRAKHLTVDSQYKTNTTCLESVCKQTNGISKPNTDSFPLQMLFVAFYSDFIRRIYYLLTVVAFINKQINMWNKLAWAMGSMRVAQSGGGSKSLYGNPTHIHGGMKSLK